MLTIIEDFRHHTSVLRLLLGKLKGANWLYFSLHRKIVSLPISSETITMKTYKTALLSAFICTLMLSQTASAHIVEIDIYKDGIEYECLQDTDTGKIFNCERD